MDNKELTDAAKALDVEGTSGMRKQELIFEIMKAQSDQSGLVFAEGVLQILQDGYGFLRHPDYNYLPGPDDIYISPSQIKRFGLTTGDTVSGQVRPLRKHEENYFALIKVLAVNFDDPDRIRERIVLRQSDAALSGRAAPAGNARPKNLSGRILDLMTPIGKGQRGLIVAPPRTGKTMLLQSLANSMSAQPPRGLPDRAADRRATRGSHRHAALGHRARWWPRPSTSRRSSTSTWPRWSTRRPSASSSTASDVVILLDSITRLARAFNTVQPPSGKILSGGIDANALQRPKRFFGAARNLEAGRLADDHRHRADRHRLPDGRRDLRGVQGVPATWSCTSIASSSTAASSPSIDIDRSGTRKEELLMSPETLNKVWILRKILNQMSVVEAMELLVDKLAKPAPPTKSSSR